MSRSSCASDNNFVTLAGGAMRKGQHFIRCAVSAHYINVIRNSAFIKNGGCILHHGPIGI
jgi:hypothetical protein